MNGYELFFLASITLPLNPMVSTAHTTGPIMKAEMFRTEDRCKSYLAMMVKNLMDGQMDEDGQRKYVLHVNVAQCKKVE
jgi:hypothetical protein